MWWSGKQFFFWKKSKNPLISLCRSLKISGNKKIQKSLILTSVKIQETIFFGKNPKILEFHCVEVWKVQEIEISKNPWSSLIWKSGKKIFFWKNPKILEFLCVKVRKFQKIKKIQKSFFTSLKIWERNSFLKKSKNPWFCKML